MLWMALAWMLLASSAVADVKKPRIGKDTPEGTFLELVTLETNSTKKIALLEQFLTIFPACDPSITIWVYGDLLDRYRRAGNLEKALAAGTKIMTLDPDNIEIAETNKALAEKKGDTARANKWSAEIEKIAERIVKSSLPQDSDDLKAAQARMDHARQLVLEADYAELMQALAKKDPLERIAALEAFVKRVPQNPYGDQIEAAELLAFKESGDFEKTLAVAERILTHNENREDALLFVIEANFGRKKDPKRTLTLAAKFVQRMDAAAVPQGVSEAEWLKAKNQNVGRVHYIVGRINFEAEQWPAADRALRLALPLLGNDQLRAAVLNDLGWANYKMQAAIEAIKFYNQCAAIKSPLQEQAAKSALSIKAEYHLP